MSVDSPFAVSATGVLSVTVRYHASLDSFFCVRLSCPVVALTHAVLDEYYIFESADSAVSLYTSARWNTDSLVQVERRDLFHIGAPLRYRRFSVSVLDSLLGEVKKYYH